MPGLYPAECRLVVRLRELRARPVEPSTRFELDTAPVPGRILPHVGAESADHGLSLLSVLPEGERGPMEAVGVAQGLLDAFVGPSSPLVEMFEAEPIEGFAMGDFQSRGEALGQMVEGLMAVEEGLAGKHRLA